MNGGYRTILEIDGGRNALDVAREQFRLWLRRKYAGRSLRTIDWAAEGLYRLTDSASLTILQESSIDHHYSRQLLELTERPKTGRWTTRLYAIHATKESDFRDVLWIETRGIGNAGDELVAKPPKLTTLLLEAVNAHDRGVPVGLVPEVCRTRDDAEQLIDYIDNQQRTVSIVVAAPLGPSHCECHRWREAIKSLMPEALGCASFFVLEGDAYTAFNTSMGSLAVPPACLRTYCPKVAREDSVDAARHRILTSMTLARELNAETKQFSERLARVISTLPRLGFWESAVDSELQRAATVLEKRRVTVPIVPAHVFDAAASVGATVRKTHKEVSSTRQTSNSIVAEPGPRGPAQGTGTMRQTAGHSVWYRPLRHFIERFVDVTAIHSMEALAAAIESADKMVAAIEQAAKSAIRDKEMLVLDNDRLTNLAYEQIEAADAAKAEAKDQQRRYDVLTQYLEEEQQERKELSDRVRRLTWQLEHQGEDVHSAFWQDSVISSDPRCVAEIYDRLTGKDGDGFDEVREYVTISNEKGVVDGALKIDEIDSNAHYAKELWRYVLVLMDYMRARKAGDFKDGDVHKYLAESRGEYRTCSQRRHRPDESETTKSNPDRCKERTFPVPASVDPNGEIFMRAHFAPTHRDQNAPRMYYYADTVKTHKVYIGYIGPHLKNTKTN